MLNKKSTRKNGSFLILSQRKNAPPVRRVVTSCPSRQLIKIAASGHLRQIITHHELIVVVESKLGDVVTTIFIDGMNKQISASCQLGHLDKNFLLPLLVGPMIVEAPDDDQTPRLFVDSDDKAQATIVALVAGQLRKNPGEFLSQEPQDCLAVNAKVTLFARRQIRSSLNVQ